MYKYLEVSKKILVPSLKTQKSKNFDWALLVHQESEKEIKKVLEYDFIPVYTNEDYLDLITTKGYNIQTRHDIDDWMSEDYIKDIQNLSQQHILKLDTFIIHSQPKSLDYYTGVEREVSLYSNKRCSMHLSLIQAEPKESVFKFKHGQMYKLTSDIFKLPGSNYTKWTLHEDSISCKRNKKLLKR